MTSRYRLPTKIVAIADLVLTVIQLSIIFYVFMVAVGLTVSIWASIVSEQDTSHLVLLWVFIALLWILLVLLLLAEVLQFVAVVKLVNATVEGIHPSDAAQKARFWRNVTIFFLILALLSFLTFRGAKSPASTIWQFFSILFHIVGIWVVQSYIRDMDRCPLLPGYVVYSPGPGGPEVVVVGPGAHIYPTLPTNDPNEWITSPYMFSNETAIQKR